MSDFVPTENDLIVNPITGKMSIGKNVDSYEEFINSSKGKSVYTKNDEFYNRLNSYAKEAKRSGRNVHCFSQTPENSKGGFLQGREIEGIQGKKKIFLGGRMIENNFNFHPEQESEKMAYFKTMGQYESSEKNGGSNNFQKLMERLKATNQNKSHLRVQKDEFVSGQGCLKNNDIKGSSPSKFNRGRKLFVDRNSIKTVLGQSPGKYHGYAQDYTHGGTYSPEDSSNIIISDLNSYSKNKITNLNYKSNKGAEEGLPNILSRNNLSSEYLLNKSLNKGTFVQGNDVYSNASESKRNHPSLSTKDDMLAYGREQRDHNICQSLATNDRCGSINNMQANNLARSPERGNFSQDKLKEHFSTRDLHHTDEKRRCYQLPVMQRTRKDHLSLHKKSKIMRTNPNGAEHNYIQERSFDNRVQRDYSKMGSNLNNSLSSFKASGKKMFSKNLKNMTYIDYLKQFK